MNSIQTKTNPSYNKKMSLLNDSTSRQHDYMSYSGKYINCSNCNNTNSEICSQNSVINHKVEKNNFIKRIELENKMRGTSQLQSAGVTTSVINFPSRELYDDFSTSELCSVNQIRQPHCTI